MNFRDEIIKIAGKKILFTQHAVEQKEKEVIFMDCIYCKGKMEKGTTSYVVNRKGYHLVLDDVPAHICTQCGEPYFEPKGVEVVQAMIQEIDSKAEALQAAG